VLPLAGVPFDEARSLVPSERGRVLAGAQPATRPLRGLYCAGWFKRGPSGVILTNIADGAETAAAVLADKAAGALGGELREGLDGPLGALLASRGIRPVDFGAWERIDLHERAEGERKGKRLAKVTAIDEMLRVAAVA
jgi:NADPH-dependent glutamate synthase beta subunit-like oxidoreductase